jgi:SNF2 family DNA or RNA helicase
MTAFELYEWQKEDVQKLVDRRGRIIAIEMGGGKTYEGLALDALNVTADNGNTLWVAPKGTIGSPQDGTIGKMFQMGLDVPYVVLDPKDRAGSWRKFKRLKGGIFFVHWEAVRLLPDLHKDREIAHWDHIVGDEIHKIQNRKAQVTVAFDKIRGGFRTGISGTPVTGAGDKYWSILNWAQPDEWRSYWSFVKKYITVEIDEYGYRHMKGVKPGMEAELLARVEPYYVRHLKREQCCPHHPDGVMPWLPDKYYTEVMVDLTPRQRQAYEEMRKHQLAWVGEHQDQPLAAPVVIAQMVRLQQFALAYADVREVFVNHRVKDPAWEPQVFLQDPSSKADAVMEILENNPTESIVVFSQFTKMLHLLASRLDKAKPKIPYVMYTGENAATRDQDKLRFLKGDARVFLGNITAGGQGIDGLQDVSSTMIFTDRLWSPALNKQAEDRLWRDGQQNAVQIIDIMARGTVDRGRHQKIELKWEWLKKMFGDR